jgi:hypothetical protein
MPGPQPECKNGILSGNVATDFRLPGLQDSISPQALTQSGQKPAGFLPEPAEF